MTTPDAAPPLAALPIDPPLSTGRNATRFWFRLERLKTYSLARALMWSLGGHLGVPLFLGILITLALLVAQWIFHLPWWRWFEAKPPEVLEFVLTQTTQAPLPKVAKILGNANQQAKSPHQPPKQSKPQLAATKPLVTPPPAVKKAPAKPSPLPPVIATPNQALNEKLSDQAQQQLKEELKPGEQAIALDTQPPPQVENGKAVASDALQTVVDPTAEPSVTESQPAILQSDFAPYMQKIKRQLTLNWQPDRSDASRQVTVLFRIGADGKLVSNQVVETSGNETLDNHALKAVELASPFEPLPKSYTGQDVPVLFTFDYTVLSRRQAD
jgi:protein TonB